MQSDRALHAMAEESYRIRPELEGDEEAIDTVLRDSFQSDAEALLVQRLRAAAAVRTSNCSGDGKWNDDEKRAPSYWLSVVAECVPSGEVVGHALFSLVTVESMNNNNNSRVRMYPALAPIGVLKQHQRRGVGGMMITEALSIIATVGEKEAAKERGGSSKGDTAPVLCCDRVFVLGSPSYYSRFGFRSAHALSYSCDFAAAPEHYDAFMVAVLDSTRTGNTAVYAETMMITTKMMTMMMVVVIMSAVMVMIVMIMIMI